MCLAVPGKIKELRDDNRALVDFMGVEKEVAVDLLENCTVGDYVIVHAGFAINKLNEEDAVESIGCFEKLLGCLE